MSWVLKYQSIKPEFDTSKFYCRAVAELGTVPFVDEDEVISTLVTNIVNQINERGDVDWIRIRVFAEYSFTVWKYRIVYEIVPTSSLALNRGSLIWPALAVAAESIAAYAGPIIVTALLTATVYFGYKTAEVVVSGKGTPIETVSWGFLIGIILFGSGYLLNTVSEAIHVSEEQEETSTSW